MTKTVNLRGIGFRRVGDDWKGGRRSSGSGYRGTSSGHGGGSKANGLAPLKTIRAFKMPKPLTVAQLNQRRAVRLDAVESWVDYYAEHPRSGMDLNESRNVIKRRKGQAVRVEPHDSNQALDGKKVRVVRVKKSKRVKEIWGVANRLPLNKQDDLQKFLNLSRKHDGMYNALVITLGLPELMIK